MLKIKFKDLEYLIKIEREETFNKETLVKWIRNLKRFMSSNCPCLFKSSMGECFCSDDPDVIYDLKEHGIVFNSDGKKILSCNHCIRTILYRPIRTFYIRDLYYGEKVLVVRDKNDMRHSFMLMYGCLYLAEELQKIVDEM